jgi:hypothetical protein
MDNEPELPNARRRGRRVSSLESSILSGGYFFVRRATIDVA